MQMTDKSITFAHITLNTFPKHFNLTFRSSHDLDDIQQCLLDNIWNTRGDGKKILNSLNALAFYFSKIENKPLSKNFSYYVILNGFKKGIFS